MIFKNKDQLEKFLLHKCRASLVGTEQKIFDIIDKCLKQFYEQFEPELYDRTEQLLHSLTRTRVVSDGKNGYKAEIYFDLDALDYSIKTLKGIGTWENTYHKQNWTHENDAWVLETAMEGGLPHGGYASGTAIWTKSEATIATLGGVYKMLEKELKMLGVPIK